MKDKLITKISELRERYPSLRLGQLLGNAMPPGQTDLYYVEDDIMLDLLRHYDESVTVRVGESMFLDEFGRGIVEPEVDSSADA